MGVNHHIARDRARRSEGPYSIETAFSFSLSAKPVNSAIISNQILITSIDSRNLSIVLLK